MKKILVIIVAFILCSLIIGDIISVKHSKSKNVNENKESEKIIMNNVKPIVEVDGNKYDVELEDNDTSLEFAELFPVELQMNDLNNNEKYIYIDTTLSSHPEKIEHVNNGDIMLYGDNCIVIFYKSFDTTYKYTKIGHIDGLEINDNKSIFVKFSLEEV